MDIDASSLMSCSLEKKLEIIEEKYTSFKRKEIFPLTGELSPEVEKEAFCKSFLIKPKIYLRLRKGYEDEVRKALKENNIEFEYPLSLPGAMALEHTSGLDQLQIKKAGLFEVQDISSQQTGTFFKPSPGEKWWDCCAGSGGKSLMLMDREPAVNLTATDIRPGILENLKERFKTAGFRKFNAFVLDLENNVPSFGAQFDGIIADVPCTGSGTWSRTPEMLSIFSPAEIESYTIKQRKILANAVKALLPSGRLVYITCSVFRAENEDQVKWMVEELNLKTENSTLIKGYNSKADSLFVAEMRKI